MSFRDRLVFDETNGTYHDGAMRYMFIKPEAVMHIALEMPEDQRPAVFEAMARSVFKNGGKSAQTYQQAGAVNPEDLLAVIRETAGQLGWGKWTTELVEGRLRVTVANSPFVMGYGASDTPVCAPILGMLRAVSGMVLGGPTDVQEVQCAATGADSCLFEAQLADTLAGS